MKELFFAYPLQWLVGAVLVYIILFGILFALVTNKTRRMFASGLDPTENLPYYPSLVWHDMKVWAVLLLVGEVALLVLMMTL